MNKKNLLIICRDMPSNKGSAENIRLYNLILLLRDHFVISVIAESASYGISQLKNLCQFTSIDQEFLNFDAFFHTAQPEYVIISRWMYASRFVDLIKQKNSKRKIQIIVDIPAVGFTQLEQRLKLDDKSFTKDEIESYKQEEITAYNEADACVVSCTADKNMLAGVVNVPIYVAPHIYQLFDEQRDLSIVNRNNIYFVGDFTYTANIDAITWLYKDILPKMLFLNQNIKLHVIGSKIPNFVKSSKNVEVPGFVNNMYEYLKNMNICLAPIRIASGMIGKVCEAMSFGIPTVMTRLVAEQLSDFKVQHLENAIIVENDDMTAFTKSVLKLVNSTNIITKISRNVKQAIIDTIDVNKIRNTFLDALNIKSEKKIEVIKTFIDDVVDTNNIGNFDFDTEQVVENEEEIFKSAEKVINEVKGKIKNENETKKVTIETKDTGKSDNSDNLEPKECKGN